MSDKSFSPTPIGKNNKKLTSDKLDIADVSFCIVKYKVSLI